MKSKIIPLIRKRVTVSLKYNGGIYLRLSKDDDCGSESSSISTQRSILREYARSHDIIIVREYVDDGFSGTDFVEVR